MYNIQERRQKTSSEEGIVGLAIGPQTIAIVSVAKQYASLRVFADELKTHKKIRKGYNAS